MTVIGPLGTWFLIIVGWWIVHITSAKRALRAEDRAEIAEITDVVAGIRDRAIEYYRRGPADADAKKDEVLLRMQLDSLNHQVRLLYEGRKKKFYELSKEHESLRKSVTGGTFGSAKRVPLPYEAGEIQSIVMTSGTYVKRLREEFERAN